MLLNLTITNFAIIDRLEAQFDAGFNVLTGETGAGKSIILDAVGLLLGDRARPDLVRAGAAEATVEALFDLSRHADVRQGFCDAGCPVDDELVLRRVVQSGGRSRAYVNGSLVTLAQLQPLAEQLVNICGQHEHQFLLQRNIHLVILDRYGSLDGQADAYRESFQAMQALARRLAKLEADERNRVQQLDLLRHQSAEIADAGLSSAEEEELVAERLLLQNAERLSAVAGRSYDMLYEGDGAVCEVLTGLSAEMQAAAAVDGDLTSCSETVQRALYELEDVAVQMRSYLSRLSFEPGRLEAIEDRLDLLSRLKRKYAPTIGEILALKEEFDRNIHDLEHAGETRDQLLTELVAQKKKTRTLGEALADARGKSARQLASALVEELAGLAMQGASFEVAFAPLSEPGPDGLERVEFMISLNPGEPLMPLARVASGGELSRLMLALRRLAPEAGKVPTMIFDEVDAGIGGAAATAVGRKLSSVSGSAQVLCVTHLPQVAAYADHHHRISKRETGGRTTVSIELLVGDDRVEEMARMLGGSQVTEQTRLHAREMIAVSAHD